jgi:fused signal recognition particle receptor
MYDEAHGMGDIRYTLFLEEISMWNVFEKLKQGLSKTHQGFVEKMDSLFLGKKTIDQDLLDELEAILFAADLGVKTTHQLIEGVRQGLKRGDLEQPEKVRDFIKQDILRILKSGRALHIDFFKQNPVFMVWESMVARQPPWERLLTSILLKGKRS